MKRFILLFSILGLLGFGLVIQAWSDARADAKKASVPAPVYDATGAMLEAINAEEAEVGIAPVYDSTGARLEATNSCVTTRQRPFHQSTTSRAPC
jgi:hypothetical protein